MSETTTDVKPSVDYDAAVATTVMQKQALLEAQAKRIAILQSEIKDRQDEIDSLKATIADQWPVGKYQAAGLTVSIKTPAKVIDAAKFMELFPPEQHSDLYKLSPDSKKARDELGKERLAPVLTTRSRKPSVVVS